MTEMRREYLEYDDMTYDDLVREDDRLKNEDNLLDETTDKAIELGKRREYVKNLMGKKFPDMVDVGGDELSRPDQMTSSVVQWFVSEEYG